MAERDDTSIPPDVEQTALRLTRLARAAVDENERTAYLEERETLLDEHGYTARVRDDETLVLHPEEWLADGVADLSAIDDVDRAVERPLSPTGEDDDWAAVEEHNADLVDRVAAQADADHAANARAFADFMGNHRARRIETATPGDVEEFLTEYYPRNAWPTDRQRDCVEASLERLFELAGADVDVRPVRR